MNEAAFNSKAQPGKKGKGKAKGCLNVCSEGENARFGVKTIDLPGELQPSWGTCEPNVIGSPEGVRANHDLPETGHVAEDASPVAEAFWALLKQAWYTVW